MRFCVFCLLIFLFFYVFEFCFFRHYKPSQKTVDAKKTVITNKMDRCYDALFVENEELSNNSDFGFSSKGKMLPTIEESVLRKRNVS